MVARAEEVAERVGQVLQVLRVLRDHSMELLDNPLSLILGSHMTLDQNYTHSVVHILLLALYILAQAPYHLILMETSFL